MPANLLSFANTDDDIRRWSFAIAAFALALQMALFWSMNFPPLHDAPNHMARHWLEAQYLFNGETSPFYTIDYKILPNLGGDLVVPPLMALFSPVIACKIFLSSGCRSIGSACVVHLAVWQIQPRELGGIAAPASAKYEQWLSGAS